jgi:hypothetical protein
MDKQSQSRAPLIVSIVLLLLPLLYVGSYFALLNPHKNTAERWQQVMTTGNVNYRAGGWFSDCCFWPIERIDRKLRPSVWGSELERIGIDFGP